MNAVKEMRMDEPAADHLTTIDWQRGAWTDKKAYRDNTPIDPHNMFVATIASAHMLTWLHMAFSLDARWNGTWAVLTAC